MSYLGAHESISGGIHKAIDRIIKVGGRTLQIFSKNQRQWKSPPLREEDVELFKTKWKRWGNYKIAIHTSYLINLASKDRTLQKKSINGLIDEINRAEILTIPYIITHPGSHGGDGIKKGIKRTVASIDSAVESSSNTDVLILIETTSGQGSSLGSRFEELAEIISSSKYPHRLGVCVDTAHIFEAGYDIRTKETYHKTLEQLIKVIGINKIHFFHLNDSKTPLGSHIDRHQHIGKGEIGLSGFKYLLNDPLFIEHPMVIETPKDKELKEDIENLKILNGLIKKGQTS